MHADPFGRLIPPVKNAVLRGGSFAMADGGRWYCRRAGDVADRILDLFASGKHGKWVFTENRSDAELCFEAGDGAIPAQGYLIDVTSSGVSVRSADDAGLYYGALTLFQLAELNGERVPCCHVGDSPDYPVRGVMLDISRDKIPTMETLLGLVDALSRLRINHMQLYMEHSFAYRGHESVWENASPMTSAEIRLLDVYCAARFVELVPNQNSFGHLERWLRLPQYNDLAALPEGGAPLPWGGVQSFPAALNPLDPRSLELLDDLYSQLLPNFRSRLFNVGCDEVFGLGVGRCAERVGEQGEGRVYLEFLQRVFSLVAARGFRPAFWGDIIVRHPELVGDIPKDAVALEWGYEADHPFDAHGRLFQESGLDYFVCPGTSSWNSIAGRHANMLENVRSAVASGLKNGACGVVLTDWGDCGHWQPLCVSYPAFVHGASLAWNSGSRKTPDIAGAVDRIFLGGECGAGELLVGMAGLYQECGALCSNSSVLFNLLFRKDYALPDGVTRENLDAIEQRLCGYAERLAGCRWPAGVEAERVRAEIAQIARLLRAACLRGKAAIDGDRVSGEFRRCQADLTEGILEAQREVWLMRNRAGGLSDSLARLAPAASELQQRGSAEC